MVWPEEKGTRVWLILVRHGASANSVEQRYTGQSDVALTSLGYRQAQALAATLADEAVDQIVCSDLLRARQTAEAVTRILDAPVRLDTDLREVAMGAWEGLTHAEVAATYPDELARWQADPERFAPPGGETVRQLHDRAAHALDRCYAEYPAGAVLWATHGGLIGVLLCHVLRLDLTHRWKFRRDNAAVSELDVGSDNGILMRLNDTSHLKGIAGAERSEPGQVL